MESNVDGSKQENVSEIFEEKVTVSTDSINKHYLDLPELTVSTDSLNKNDIASSHSIGIEDNVITNQLQNDEEDDLSDYNILKHSENCEEERGNLDQRTDETIAVMALTELMSLRTEEKEVIYKSGETVCNSMFAEKRLNLIDLIKTDKEMQSFTGVNINLFNNLAKAYSLKQSKMKDEEIKIKICMCLCKLRLNLSFSCLSVLFFKHEKTCARNFYETLEVLADILKSAVYWPDKEEILSNMPICFEKFRNTRLVLDCTEIPLERPACLKCRLRSYSHYKGTETVKILIGISPAGQITFLSSAFGGRASDKTIFNKSKILEKLIPGVDAVMVDKGFSIDEECANYNIKLWRPPMLGKQKQMNFEDFQSTKRIAAARVHVERVIQRIKIFKICQSRIKWNLIKHLDNIFVIICGLVNLSAPILSDNKFL